MMRTSAVIIHMTTVNRLQLRSKCFHTLPPPSHDEKNDRLLLAVRLKYSQTNQSVQNLPMNVQPQNAGVLFFVREYVRSC